MKIPTRGFVKYGGYDQSALSGWWRGTCSYDPCAGAVRHLLDAHWHVWLSHWFQAFLTFLRQLKYISLKWEMREVCGALAVWVPERPLLSLIGRGIRTCRFRAYGVNWMTVAFGVTKIWQWAVEGDGWICPCLKIPLFNQLVNKTKYWSLYIYIYAYIYIEPL